MTQRLAQKIRDKFGKDFSLTVAIGGQISMDVFPKGWDKTYCLQFIDQQYDKIYFFGDRCQKGGNDYEIYNHERVIGNQIKGGP